MRSSQLRRIRPAERHGDGESGHTRVDAYMPDIPETLAALLASASLGTIWSGAAPEYGPHG
jgi:acetoacetyl-CoA synthetase